MELDPLTVKAIELDVRLLGRILFSPDYAKLRSITMMGATPYLSLILKEVIGTLGLQIDQIGFGDSAKLRLLKSRNESKILTHEAPLELLLSESQNLIGAYVSGFQELHSGRRFAPLWKRIQPDLGLYFREGRFVTNTFTLHQDVGLTVDQARALGRGKDNIGPMLFQDGNEYGQVIGVLANALSIDTSTLGTREREMSAEVEGFRFRDVRSATWLETARRRLGCSELSLVYLLLNVLSRVQTSRHLASVYTRKNSWEEAKLKVLYSFHAIGSIEKIVAHDANTPSFSEETRKDIRSILGLSSSKSIKAMRRLRNFAAHYKLLPQTLTSLNGASDFDSLIRVETNLSSLQSLVEVLDENLSEIATLLTKYFDFEEARARPL